VCGPGRDHVSADAKDKVAKDCEVVTGLPKPPAISIDDATVAEGSAGASTLSFAVRLSAASTKIVSVHYVTADGTASATAADYAATNGIVTFQPGSTTGKIDVAVTGDSTIEPDETLTVTLSAPVNGTIADGSATGTIQNDDRSPHPGHYAGTTSQGKAIGFDVAADSASLSNLSFASDLNCTEVPVQIRNLSITIPGPVAVATDRTFSGQFSGGDSDATIAGTMHGSFDPLGKGTGTIRVDFTINTDAGPLHCSSGDLTWSAS
jgi:hypothetical protein